MKGSSATKVVSNESNQAAIPKRTTPRGATARPVMVMSTPRSVLGEWGGYVMRVTRRGEEAAKEGRARVAAREGAVR